MQHELIKSYTTHVKKKKYIMQVLTETSKSEKQHQTQVNHKKPQNQIACILANSLTDFNPVPKLITLLS